jgi:hypothetical protein
MTPNRVGPPGTVAWSAWLVVFLVLALDVAPVTGQDTPLFSIGSGPALPAGTTRDTHRTGVQVGATGVFPVARRLGVEVNGSYVRLGADRDIALTALGIDPSTFGSAGGLFEGGYHWAGALTVGARILLRPRDRQVVPNLSAGAGYALTGTADQYVVYLGERETYPGTRESAPVATFGGGVEVHLGGGIGVFGSVRHLVVFTEPRRLTATPISIGLSLRLEERQRPE